MLGATILTGLAAGVAGAGFVLALHLVQHVAFGYTEETFLVGVQHTSPGRRVLAMTIGGLIVGLGWWQFHRHIDSEDVSVTRALREPAGRLPIAATTADAVLQVFAVGVGASLGREGAPRQVGASLGGWSATRLNVSAARRRTLLACGAGAGLAAVYNVPLGGAAFTLEVLLVSVTLADLIPAVLTAAIATIVAWPVVSSGPIYRADGAHLTASVTLWALLAGPAAGVMGVAFVRLTTAARTRAPTGARSIGTIVLAFAAVGTVSIAYPQLLGNGKGPAELAFTGAMSLGLAAALLILKPLASAICLRGGAIGGLLTPAFATGAALGVLGGRLWDSFWPGTPIVDYAIIGAAALLAVTQHAPLTSIILTIELLHTGQSLLLPILIAVVLASFTAWIIDHQMLPTMLRRWCEP